MDNLRRAYVQTKFRPVSTVFIGLVIFLIGGVVYAGWSSATITITPRLANVTASFPIAISAAETPDSTELPGTISSEDISATVTVTPKGSGTPVPARATGQVTLKNTTATSQPLTTGTRLRSTTDVIVRTTTRVDVPAGGSVVADVVADPLGEEGNLPPGKFVIVALWPGLQDKIFGESSEAMTGGLVSGGLSLSLDELTTASNQAEEEVRTKVGTSRLGNLISLEPSSVVSTPKPEVASASYKVTVTLKVTTVTYPTDRLTPLLKTELAKAVPQGQSLETLDEPTLTIQDRPLTEKIILQVDGRAVTKLSDDHPLLKPAAFIGLTAEEILQKFSDQTVFKSAHVKFSPWWRNHAPDQPDRITVKVLPAES